MHATTPRRAALSLALAALAAAGLYLLLPRIAGLDDTWNRLREGNIAWLALALVAELGSYLGYLLLFEAVLAPPPARIDRRRALEITLAGVAATRLLATGGAGGIALTAWALRRSGLETRTIGRRMTTFMVLLYAVFMIGMLAVGVGLQLGLLPGPAPWGLTVVPAAFAGAVILLALALTLIPHDLHAARRGRVMRWVATASATVGDGVRGALRAVRHPQPRLLGAVAWWAMDIATLWACLRAFGGLVPLAPLVMAYFVGQLGNLLPLPGGIGGVDGALIGALVGFGTPTGLAIAGVLAYRAFAFWLPTVPGVIAYLRLLRDARLATGP
jgi:uncharacterized membrane protein YbhN (UPF0104 family)